MRQNGGMLITLEGGEGCGKSTQVRHLAERLEISGYTVVVTRDPGGTVIGDKLRAILLDGANTNLSDIAEVMLYMASRAQLIENVIAPAIEAGYVVISDRFIDSTLVYQHLVRNSIDLRLLNLLNDYVCGEYQPDVTFILDIDPEIGLKRSLSRLQVQKEENGLDESRWENEHLAIHQKINDAYVEVVKMYKGKRPVYHIDAVGEIDVIASEIYELSIKHLEDK